MRAGASAHASVIIPGYTECPACRNGLEFEPSCAALLASASPRMLFIWTTVEQDGPLLGVARQNSQDLALAIPRRPIPKQARHCCYLLRSGIGWRHRAGGIN